jgi:hypothetical protein
VRHRFVWRRRCAPREWRGTISGMGQRRASAIWLIRYHSDFQTPGAFNKTTRQQHTTAKEGWHHARLATTTSKQTRGVSHTCSELPRTPLCWTSARREREPEPGPCTGLLNAASASVCGNDQVALSCSGRGARSPYVGAVPGRRCLGHNPAARLRSRPAIEKSAAA